MSQKGHCFELINHLLSLLICVNFALDFALDETPNKDFNLVYKLQGRD
jgi:hypothetical protein